MRETRTDAQGELERIEISLLLEAIYRRYGYDFRSYKYSTIRRRIWHRIGAERLQTVSGLQERILHDASVMNKLFADFSINVTEMFRDPSFFSAIRRKVLPALSCLPVIRIWNAGCSTGEEVYSMAIALYEGGLYHKSTIYGTDMNPAVLGSALTGRFPLGKMKQYTKNYLFSGGTRAFSEYYTVEGDEAAFHPFLSDNLVFSQHNLVTDHSFNEFHLIICRNVLIYFNEAMQLRVLGLMNSSLVDNGFLCLGNKESIQKHVQEGAFHTVDGKERIYRRLQAAMKEERKHEGTYQNFGGG